MSNRARKNGESVAELQRPEAVESILRKMQDRTRVNGCEPVVVARPGRDFVKPLAIEPRQYAVGSVVVIQELPTVPKFAQDTGVIIRQPQRVSMRASSRKA